MDQELQGSSAAVPPLLPLDDDDESRNKYYYWNTRRMISDDFDDDFGGGPRRRRESMVNKLISTVYSGPTISDIESALSFTGGGDQQQLAVMDAPPSPVVFSPEKVLSKMENKYTLKMKTCGNGGLAEDGYKWRKYGQKSIKNSPNPRSYYRCTNPRCNAKKQVERATDEADTLLVTYEGLHLHYTYEGSSSFLLSSSSKKPKLHGPPPAAQADDLLLQAQAQEQILLSSPSPRADLVEEEEDLNTSQRMNGLLEDVVPLLVRRPAACTSTSSSSSNNSSSCSPPAAPSPPSSVSAWPYYIDMAILSNIF